VRNTLIVFAALLIAQSQAWSQTLTQNVTGRITDRLTGLPLEGAGLKLIGADTIISGTSGKDGSFSLVAGVGRYKASATFTGYGTFHDELLVISGKEIPLSISLAPVETMLQAVEVESQGTGEEVPGLQSLSIEKTLRVPANFFDPVRVVTAYPGVVAANDQANGIIVRGNSPNGLLWRLNGLDVVNPNHLSNAGTLSDRPTGYGGGVNILSAQMLDRTDFFMGFIPARYGNAIAGVVDMRTREGNKAKKQYTAQASLIGVDLSAESPIGKSGQHSVVANYRYSTVGLLSAIGVNFGDEAIRFQDFSLAADFNQKNGGKITVFGIWGTSDNDFEKTDSSEWEEEKDRYRINYQARTYGAGLTYVVPVGNGKLWAGTAYSSSRQERLAQPSSLNPPFMRLIVVDDYNAQNGIWSTQIRYDFKAGKKMALGAGVVADFNSNFLETTKVVGCLLCQFPDSRKLEGDADGLLIQPFATIDYSISPMVNLSAGMRYVHYTYNEKGSAEPRIVLNLRPGTSSSFDLAYSLTSQVQLPVTYLTADNPESLELTKSHHVDAGYSQHLTEKLKIRTGVFYQKLFDVPIEDDPSSTFSMLNYLDGFIPDNLASKGTGENYGVDATIEKYFYTSSYLLLSASYYESTYEAGDGEKRDTRFNGNYTFSSVYGKEWTKREKNRTIGLNTRLLYLGGMRESDVSVIGSQMAGETVYSSDDPFNNKLDDYFRIDLRLSFRKNKPNYTRTFAIDIQNLTSQQNVAFNYYDQTQTKVITKYQLGIIPVLVYRIDF
jgi:hypothetical protein